VDFLRDPHESDSVSPTDGIAPEPLVSRDPLFEGVAEICEAAMQQARADGAALAVLTRSGRVRRLVFATDSLAQRLDELQYTIGEGPCFDAYLEDAPQFYPELTNVAQTSRWPTFARDATQLGVYALFAFPVPDGRRPMGVLELYRRAAGALAELEYVAAAASAEALAHRLESNWQDHVSRFGSASQAVDAAGSVGAEQDESADPFTLSQIHVAAGMVAVQLGIGVGVAVDRLRAYSYASGQRLSAVAADVIAGRLHLPQ
jgi:hypothetical protein